MTGTHFRNPRLWVIAILFALLLTNRWMSWSSGVEFLSLLDVSGGYQKIAESVPQLPAESMPFHIAQRLSLPFTLGVFAKTAGISVPAAFTLCLAFIHILLIFGLSLLLERLNIPPARRLLAFALFALQPYALRYYWIGPGMAGDSLFALGALLLLSGLFLGSAPALLGGITLASLSRQTALLVIPGVALYLWRGNAWNRASLLRRGALFAACVILAVLVYIGTGRVAQLFALPSQNAQVAYGILTWLRSNSATWLGFGEHLLRCLLPLAPCLMLLHAENPRHWKLETWSALLVGVAIASQPFLAGPELTGQNAGRLTTLALLPLALGWAVAGQHNWRRGSVLLALGILFIGSFHHMYTVVGPGGPMGTAALQLLVVFALAVLSIRERIYSRKA